MYTSTKIIDGFSTCFRQEAAAPIHCALLHGYSISFEVTFRADQLDSRNWVVDFGFLKRSDYKDSEGRNLHEWFCHMFDHTVVVSEKDTQLEWFKKAHELNILELRVVEAVGCEKFAELVYHKLCEFLAKIGRPDVVVTEVVCRENGKNSASIKF